MIDINNIRQKFFQMQGKKQQIEADLTASRNNLAKLEKRMTLIENGQSFLQKVAQETQSKLKFQIEDIVNMALETCFPNEYVFQLNFNIARGKTDAELVFLSQRTGRELDPMNCAGGGVVDITTFALRIASFMLEQNVDNVIILDEPMKFVSKDLQSRVGDILKKMSEKLGIQIIMVTHISEMVDVADRVFEVKKNVDGRSIVKEDAEKQGMAIKASQSKKGK